MRPNSKVISAILVGALGASASTVAGEMHASADEAAPAVVLRTATMLIRKAENGPVRKLDGAGVMDAHVGANSQGRMLLTWTDSIPRNRGDDNGFIGAIASVQLTESGLQIIKETTHVPELNGEREYMRPLFGVGEPAQPNDPPASVLALNVFAAEDQGRNNNNPQSVAYVFDGDGNRLAITNSTRNNDEKPTNLITLAGRQDDQQWGPHSICPLGRENGADAFLVGMQRNNQSAWVGKVLVEKDGNGARVTVPYLTRVENDAQHSRPQVECAPIGSLQRNTRVITTVEANDQPADVGVRAILFDIDKGEVVQSKLIAKTDKSKGVYAVQPNVAFLGEGIVGITWAKSANARGGRNNGNGHTGGENLSMLTTLKVSANDADAFQQLDEISRVAPYQRHARGFGTYYGAGDGSPAVAVLAGSSTGTGKGLMQILPVDSTTGKVGAMDPFKLYEVSSYSDVANLPARGKRNPQDQGAGFVNAFGGVANPGYQKPMGFMPEVKTFTISAMPGYADIQTDDRDSLFLSLVPSTWDPAMQTVPGPVTDANEIQPGPSPRTTTPQAVQPPGEDPFNEGGDYDYGGPSLPSEAGGCSLAVPGEGSPTGVAWIGLGLGIALAIRRRSAGKEQGR